MNIYQQIVLKTQFLLGKNCLDKLTILIIATLFTFHSNLTTALNEVTPTGSIKLRYNVNIYGTNLGEVHTTITKDQKKFSLSSITKAEGAASLILGGDLIQECNFETTDDEIISDASRVEKMGRNAFQREVQINWNSRDINYNNESILDIPQGYLVDSCNFQFAAAFTHLDVLKANTIYVLDGKDSRMKAYVFRSANKEMLKTPMGEFETTKIVLERELNPDKSFSFWITEDHPYFPLKMVEKRDSRSRIMTIKSYEENSIASL